MAMSMTVGAVKRRRAWPERLYRLARLRLLIPLFRSSGRPEVQARGVMVGLFWAMLPLFGTQMTLVFFTWVFCRRFLGWDFSLSQGLAWTWVTNVFTVIPTYYLYYVTGQVLSGDFDDISGYEKFVSWFDVSSVKVANWFDSTMHGFVAFLSDWGWPILLGSLPWTVVTTIAGYYLSLRVLDDYRRRRAERGI